MPSPRRPARRLARRLVATSVVAAAALGAADPLPRTAQDSRADVYYVAPGGSDTTIPGCDGGSAQRPWRTLTFAFACLTAGDRLWVRGGDYPERVLTPVNRGRADAPIRVEAHPGERPVVVGLVRLEVADHWNLEGINVTGDGRPYGSGEYLVKMRGGVGWTYADAEIWNARSYAAFRVESSAKGALGDWRIVGNCIHDTWPTNGTNEDHNIYVDTGPGSGRGIVARNLVFDAPNGANIKLGPGADPTSATGNVVVTYNTLWNGVQNVLANGRSHHLRVERNILGHVIQRKSWYPHVRGFDLDGGDNVVKGNVGTGPAKVVLNDRHSSRGWRDVGGNRAGVHPRFDRTAACDGFHPGTVAAYTYGRWAPPQPRPRPVRVACPSDRVPSAGYRDVPETARHRLAIDCMTWREVARGVTFSYYLPARPVTRGEMATFVARLIARTGGELPVVALDAFDDDDGSPHEHNIDGLHAAGLVEGVGGRRFAPEERVSRGQLATMLVRAYAYRTGETLPRGPDYFGDDSGDPHQGNINAATLAGFTSGVADGRYEPWLSVSRGQMATFVARVYDLVVDG